MKTLALHMSNSTRLTNLPNLTRLLSVTNGFPWASLKNTQITELVVYYKQSVFAKMTARARALSLLTLIFEGELHTPQGIYLELHGPGLKQLRIRYAAGGNLNALEERLSMIRLDASLVDRVSLDIPAVFHQARKIIEPWYRALPAALRT